MWVTEKPTLNVQYRKVSLNQPILQPIPHLCMYCTRHTVQYGWPGRGYNLYGAHFTVLCIAQFTHFTLPKFNIQTLPCQSSIYKLYLAKVQSTHTLPKFNTVTLPCQSCPRRGLSGVEGGTGGTPTLRPPPHPLLLPPPPPEIYNNKV